jgi:hypothetical protein
MSRKLDWRARPTISREWPTASGCLASGERTTEPRPSCWLSKCVVSTVSLLQRCGHSFGSQTVISFYSSSIFERAGYSAVEALYASLGYGAVQVVFTIPTLFMIDTVGRRRLCLIVSQAMFSGSNKNLANMIDVPLDVHLLTCGWSLVVEDGRATRCSDWAGRTVSRATSVPCHFCLTTDSSTCSPSCIRSVKAQWLSSIPPRYSQIFSVNREWLSWCLSTTSSVRQYPFRLKSRSSA